MPYEKVMSEKQANEKIEEMGPDCWYRLVRNGNDLKIYISRNGDDWDLRTVFDLREQAFDIMIPVVLPLPEYKPPKGFEVTEHDQLRYLGESDEEDIS